MNYQKIYENLIQKALGENRKKSGELYYEIHHIKPMFLFDCKRTRYKKNKDKSNPNHIDNIVLLTFKEHVFAHVLLYKIYEKTSHSYSALSALNLMMGTKGNHKRVSEYLKQINYISNKKKEYSNKLSLKRKGMLMCKDASTNKIVGFVSKKDPKYLSGEYVFFQKGIKRTQHFKDKKSKPGELNTNYSGFDDEILETSFLTCVEELNFIPSQKIWIGWAKINNQPYLTSFKKFRFNGDGFNFLINVAEKKTNLQYDEYFTRKKENFEFIKENKNKWEN